MVTNNLFNQPLMNKYLRKYKKELSLSHSRKEAVLKWIKKLEKGELKDEVANYGNFSRIILEDILGYDYGENILENKKEDYGRGLFDFSLSKDKKKANQDFMVIELKGSDSDLDKPQTRQYDKRKPIDQAFDYAKRSDLDWIMVSNYREFRLYNWHKKQHQYISFKAEDLQDPEIFKLFMLVFSKFSTIDNNLIEKLVSKTIFVERDFEAEFYKLFNETRLMIMVELEYLHPEFTREDSVHYAQLILNRYIFICFAEDLRLLPPEMSFESILNPVKNNDLGRSEIWHKLNRLFMDLNEGNDFKKIFGYNGGLFSGVTDSKTNSKFDETPEFIESLKIRDIVKDQSIFEDTYQKWKFLEYSLIVDEKLGSHYNEINPIYRNLMTISTFDFSSEVDVNILGHIFENSIGEIEELKADTKGRRKKEGIFYTPEYITDYICRNTIIPYLSKTGKANTIKDLIDEYWGSEIEKLEDNVRKIRIIDPACGSGAFLNKAGDVLVEIHKAIREHKYKSDKSLMPFFDTIEERRKILLDNIYGVDLNEESVEITKLSLFLKVCKKGLKLPNLDNNIKCGNSLIDDPDYTDKPFNWKSEFKDIFKDDGFDIVIGNPPYVRQERIKKFKPYFKNIYKTYASASDLYVYFFEKGLELLKKSGKLAFITSNKFERSNYGKPLKKLLLNNTTFEIHLEFNNSTVFQDATVHTCILVLKKDEPLLNNKIWVNNSFEMEQSKLNEDSWVFEHPNTIFLKEKIDKQSILLKSIQGIKINRGITTGFNQGFIINENEKDKLIEKNLLNKKFIKPLLRGKDTKRYSINSKNHSIIVIPSEFTNSLEIPESDLNSVENFFSRSYHSIYDYLSKFKDVKSKGKGLLNRDDQGDYWWELRPCDYYSEFEKEKIIWSEMAPSPYFSIDKENYYLLDTMYLMTLENNEYDLSYILALMNSSLLSWRFKYISPQIEGKRLRYKKQYVEKLPIYPAKSDQQKQLIKKADVMLKLNKELFDEINGFKDWLKRTPFKIEKFSKMLNKYYKLNFDLFLTELNKKNVDTKQRKIQELLKEGFEESIIKINPLLQEIEKNDNEIDQMVYELYGLDDNEIELVEKSLKA